MNELRTHRRKDRIGLWIEGFNGVLLVGAVTVAAIAALIRQTYIFTCAMLWIWTVCCISTGYALGRRRAGRVS